MESLNVTFVGKQGQGSSFLQLELDDTKNEGATVFTPGGEAYLRLFPSGENPQLVCNIGSVSVQATGLEIEVVEDVVLVDTATVSTKYPVFKLLDYSWLGRYWGNGVVRVEDERKEITLAGKTTGVLRVRYTTKYDRLVAKYGKDCTQLVAAIKDSDATYIDIKWKKIEKDVVIVVKDACSRAVISEASVYIDGKLRGSTDKNGKLSVGKLPVGKHSLKIVKEGYQPTDKDNVKNDFFVVSDE